MATKGIQRDRLIKFVQAAFPVKHFGKELNGFLEEPARVIPWQQIRCRRFCFTDPAARFQFFSQESGRDDHTIPQAFRSDVYSAIRCAPLCIFPGQLDPHQLHRWRLCLALGFDISVP